MDIQNALESSFALREKLIRDPHRPRYHFLPADGFWNDINGTLYWKGRYHVFYLARKKNEHPEAIDEDRRPSLWEWQPVWAHVSSRDLIHWRYHPAFLPSGRPDMPQGYYSGDAVEGADRPTLIYHVPMQGTCIAVSDDDDLDTWTPLPENPVIHWQAGDKRNTALFDDLSDSSIAGGKEKGGLPECTIFDPCGWKEDDGYYALIGNKNYRKGYEGDSTSLFRSKDLKNWDYIGPFYRSERRWTDEIEDCACPDFFPFGDRHMLLMHTHRPYGKSQYYIGTYRDHRFYPESHGQLSYRGSLHMAPETLVDGAGRRIYWGWVAEARDDGAFSSYPRRGWGSVMTLPWHLYPSSDNALRIKPADELRTLRYDPIELGSISLASGEERSVDPVVSNCMEINMTAVAEPGAAFGVKLLRSSDGREQTVITYDMKEGRFIIDFERASLSRDLRYPDDSWRQVVPYLPRGKDLELDIFVDRSIIEIFVNNDICIVQRVYPTLAESRGVSLFSAGGKVLLRDTRAWEMDAINPW